MTNSEVERPIITVIDYQAGNIRSVEKALEKSGASVRVSGKASDLEKSDAVVFPGQGSCDSSMVNLRNQGLDEVLVEWINSGKPFMGGVETKRAETALKAQQIRAKEIKGIREAIFKGVKDFDLVLYLNFHF